MEPTTETKDKDKEGKDVSPEEQEETRDGKAITELVSTTPDSSGTDDNGTNPYNNLKRIDVFRTRRGTNQPVSLKIIDNQYPKQIIIHANDDAEAIAYLREKGFTDNGASETITIRPLGDLDRERLADKRKEKLAEEEAARQAAEEAAKQSKMKEGSLDGAGGNRRDPYLYYSYSEDFKMGNLNNTGIRILRSDGSPVSMKEAFTFIKAQIDSGNPLFIDLFPYVRIGDGNEIPTFTIPNDKTKKRMAHYQYAHPSLASKNKDQFVKNEVSIPAKVNSRRNGKPYKGINLYVTPAPDQLVKDDDTTVLIPPRTPVTIIATTTEDNKGWIKIQAGEYQGWVNENYINEKVDKFTEAVTMTTIDIEKDATIEGIINKYYADHPKEIGFGNKDYAKAIAILNKDNPALKLKDNGGTWTEWGKAMVDPARDDVRKNYRMIQIDAGGELRLPKYSYVQALRDSGEIGTRSEFENALITGARMGKGFMTGIQNGFINAGADAITGLWDMLKGLLNGQLFTDIYDMASAFMKMSWTELWKLAKQIIGDEIQKFVDISKIENVEKKYAAYGELIGAMLFEVAIAALGGGAVNMIKKLENVKELQGLVNVVKKVQGVKARLGEKAADMVQSAKKKLSLKQKKSGLDIDVSVEDALKNKISRNQNKEIMERLDKEDRNTIASEDVQDSNPDAASSKKSMLKKAEDIVTAADKKNQHPMEIMGLLNTLALTSKHVRGFTYKQITFGTFAVYMHGSLTLVRTNDTDHVYNIVELSDAENKKYHQQKKNGQRINANRQSGGDRIIVPKAFGERMKALYAKLEDPSLPNDKYNEVLDELYEKHELIDDLLDHGTDVDIKEIRKQLNINKNGTAQLRQKIGPQPKFFQGHHIVPRELEEKHAAFFKDIGFDMENGAHNGIMSPPDTETLSEVSTQFQDMFKDHVYHKGSHPEYTKHVDEKIIQIKNGLKSKAIDHDEAVEAMEDLVRNIRLKIMYGNKGKKIDGPKTMNELFK